MMRPLSLETFEPEQPTEAAPAALSTTELEEMRLDAFETGYRAGWDDASSAQSDEEARLRAALSRHLQDLAFSYQEARVHVLRSVGPLIADAVASLLPRCARQGLPHLVAEALQPYAELAAEAPVQIRLHPQMRPEVEALVGAPPGLPLAYHEDAALPQGQVWLQLGASETRIDVDAAFATIRRAIDEFFELAAKETHHE